MQLAGISFIGWIHTLACLAALLLGAANLLAAKGTPGHRRRGDAYVIAMVVAMVLSFAIYRFDIPLHRGAAPGPGVFGLFHWFSVSALVFTLVGWYAARRQARAWAAYVHPIAMILSYYVLVGGLINELFARVNWLRPYAVRLVHGQPVFPSRTVQLTQFAAEIAALVLIALYAVKVWRLRRQLRSS